MNAKTTLFALFAAALLVPTAALADRDRDREGWHARDRYEHRHGPGCRHGPEPRRRAGGRYELRTVSTWVEGYHQRYWVPGRCWEERRGRHGHRTRTVCAPGRYEQRWVDGHYVEREEWVWVPYRYGGHRHRS